MQHRLIASYAVLVCLALGLFAIPDTVNLSRLLHRNQEEVALREAHTIAFLLGAVVDSEVVDATEEQVTARALPELRQAFEAETGGASSW